MAVFRVERTKDFTVMSNHHLRNKTLSLKAKGLQSLMLSLPEDWDYTMAGLAHICRDGLSSIRGAITELEEQGYLQRRRLRNSKGQLAETEYTILEQPVLPDSPSAPVPANSPICENRTQAPQPICDFPTLENPILDSPTQGKPMLENRTQLSIQESSIQQSNMQESNIHPIHPDGLDEMAYRSLLMENMEHGILSERYGRERVDEVLELMLETFLSRRETIRIAGDEFPAEIVKSRLMKVDSSHVEYVFDCLDRNRTHVRNIKAYLLTALFNAPATIDSYYRAEVNHDLEGGCQNV